MNASSTDKSTKTIAITGGLGNLGKKLCNHLLDTTSHNIILMEHPAFITPQKTPKHSAVKVFPIDLGHPSSAQTLEVLKNVDTVVHFSAVNPYPNATWSESAQSMDHTFAIFQAAVLHKGEIFYLLAFTLAQLFQSTIDS